MRFRANMAMTNKLSRSDFLSFCLPQQTLCLHLHYALLCLNYFRARGSACVCDGPGTTGLPFPCKKCPCSVVFGGSCSWSSQFRGPTTRFLAQNFLLAPSHSFCRTPVSSLSEPFTGPGHDLSDLQHRCHCCQCQTFPKRDLPRQRVPPPRRGDRAGTPSPRAA